MRRLSLIVPAAFGLSIPASTEFDPVRCDPDERIFTTTIPTDTVRPCLLQDPLYRMHVASQTSGYYSGAHVGAADRP